MIIFNLMEEDKYYTDLEEITTLTYDTDLYQKVRELTASKNYEVNHLFNKVVQNINIHHAYFLKDLQKGSVERKEFIFERIEWELKFMP